MSFNYKYKVSVYIVVLILISYYLFEVYYINNIYYVSNVFVSNKDFINENILKKIDYKKVIKSINTDNEVLFIVNKLNLEKNIRDPETKHILENYERSFYSNLFLDISENISNENLMKYIHNANVSGKITLVNALIRKNKDYIYSDFIRELLVNKNEFSNRSIYKKGFNDRVCDIMYNLIVYNLNKGDVKLFEEIDNYDEYNSRDSKIDAMIKYIHKRKN